MTPARCTRPSKSLLEGCAYVNADHTNIRKRFEAMAEAQKQAPNVTTLKKRSKP